MLTYRRLVGEPPMFGYIPELRAIARSRTNPGRNPCFRAATFMGLPSSILLLLPLEAQVLLSLLPSHAGETVFAVVLRG